MARRVCIQCLNSYGTDSLISFYVNMCDISCVLLAIL